MSSVGIPAELRVNKDEILDQATALAALQLGE